MRVTDGCQGYGAIGFDDGGRVRKVGICNTGRCMAMLGDFEHAFGAWML
jgi:hypothetical protein